APVPSPRPAPVDTQAGVDQSRPPGETGQPPVPPPVEPSVPPVEAGKSPAEPTPQGREPSGVTPGGETPREPTPEPTPTPTPTPETQTNPPIGTAAEGGPGSTRDVGTPTGAHLPTTYEVVDASSLKPA